MTFILFKVLKFVGGIIVAVAVIVAVMPNDNDARSLGVTGAKVGGTATDIVITDMIPAFFGEIGSKA